MASIVESNMPKEPGRYFPGVSYIPDQIEVAEDKELMTKIYLEFLDFLQCMTNFLDLMHILKNRHLRTTSPVPHNVLREMLALGDKGRLYKEFDRRVQEITVGVSTSLDSILRGGSGANKSRAIFMPIIHKTAEQPQQLARFQNSVLPDLHEITGKKSKPIWHTVALEKEDFLSSHPPPSDRRVSLMSSGEDIPPCKYAGRDIKRSGSQIIYFSTKFCLQNKIPASNPKFQRQMDMMLASKAGFVSVEAHHAYVATKRAQWYRDFVHETAKLGLMGCDEVIEAFYRLGKHYDMTRDSLPFAKAKMCLLIMSLPFWDVARIHSQRAIEFILERILHIHPDDERPLQEWLKARKIPYVVIRPTMAQNYLARELTVPSSQQSLSNSSKSNE